MTFNRGQIAYEHRRRHKILGGPRYLDMTRGELSESPAAHTNGTNNCSGGPILTIDRTVFELWLGSL